jgi:hypothetical protein
VRSMRCRSATSSFSACISVSFTLAGRAERVPACHAPLINGQFGDRQNHAPAPPERGASVAESAQLGQFRQQGGADHRTDAGDATQQVMLLSPQWAAAHRTAKLLIHTAQPLAQPGDVLLDVLTYGSWGAACAALLGHEYLEELSTAGDRGSQGLGAPRRRRAEAGRIRSSGSVWSRAWVAGRRQAPAVAHRPSYFSGSTT